MRRAVGHLFCFSKEVVRPAIQHHAANHFQRHQFFGNQLGRIQMIERETVRFLLREKLYCEFPLGEITGRDSLKHIAAVEILVGTGNLNGFIPNSGLQTEIGPPVEFDEG